MIGSAVRILLGLVVFFSLVIQTVPAKASPLQDFVFGGNIPWFSQTAVSHDGVDAHQSGAITHNQSSWMETTVTGPGAVRFWWKVSSESYCDLLTFSIDGTSQANISGAIDWQSRAFTVPTGSHTLRWTYSTDGSVLIGSNAGWVDQVTFETGNNIDVTPPTTTATPAGGTYASSQNVTLAANEPATIYYTTNGSDPTTASSQYSAPIPIGTTTSIKYFALDGTGNYELVKTATYNFDTTPPSTSTSLSGGSYSGARNVSLFCSDSGMGCNATYYCLGSGCTPTTLYSTAIPITASADLRYYSVDRGGNAEAVRTTTYTITADTTPPVTTPSYQSGTYSNPYVYLFCSDVNGSGCAATYYCLGSGCTPTTRFTSGLSITSSTDLRFFSQDNYGNNEATKTVSYTIDNTPPTTSVTPTGGISLDAQSVTLACSDSSGSGCAAIYYCLGKGCYPNTPYSGPINITSSEYLTYYSRDVVNNSEIAKTERYTILTAPPITINVPADQTTIQSAIDAAKDGDTVLVAPGTYMENINFNGKAIIVASTGGADVTIIDGNQAGSVAIFSSGEERSTKLDGFTLRNGNADSGSSSNWDGGGIYIANSSPTILNNKIIANSGDWGGGIYVGFGSPLIRNNIIKLNRSSSYGGGIEIGGSASAQIVNNIIEENTSNDGGGGISMWSAGTPTIAGNTIKSNSANSGGGIHMVNSCSPRIIQNVISGNHAGSGGGIYWSIPSSPPGITLVNNTIAENDAAQGAGIFAGGFDANARVMNNIILAKSGQTALQCEGNYDNLSPQLSNNVVFSPGVNAYSGICSDQNGINGNITADPLLANPQLGYHGLLPGSPAIDAGDNTVSSLPATDFGGMPRLVDGNSDSTATIDIGAYEFDPAYPVATLQGIPTAFLASSSLSITVGGTSVTSYRYALDGGAFGAETAVAMPISLTGLTNGQHSIVVLGKNAQGVEQLLSSATAATWVVNTETTNLTFSSGGANPWFLQPTVSRDGIAYQSGAVTSNQSSWLETTVTGPGAIRFWWKDSSASYANSLAFTIDGTNKISISGEVDWQYKAFTVPVGSHTLRWTYSAGSYIYPGVNTAWLDKIVFETGSNIDVTPPATLATPAAGAYSAPQNITLAANEPATIYYTTNGSDPTTESSRYTTPFAITPPVTLKYFAVDTAGNFEAVKTAAYTLDTTPPTTTASYPSGSYSPIQVYLYCSDPGGCASTFYCLGSGCTPTTLSSGYVSVSDSTDLRFYSVDRAGNREQISTVSYTIDHDSPVTTPSVAGGIYSASQSVTLACSDGSGSGCSTTYYCLSKECSPHTPYSGPIDITSSTYVSFFSRDKVYNEENTKTERYTIITAPAATINVPADHSTIQAAIDAANDGDTIRVAPGTYVENIDFKGKAITVQSSAGPDTTIIDGSRSGAVVSFTSGEWLTSILDGFTVRNGTPASDRIWYGDGGGVTIYASSPLLRNNRIIANFGCAAVSVRNGSPLIQGNLIADNNLTACAYSEGGSVYLRDAAEVRLVDNSITGNSVGLSGGGGISVKYSKALIRGNSIRNNSTSGSGGGIALQSASNTEITQNVVAGNRAERGGGIYFYDSYGASLVNNTIAANDARDGGGIYSFGASSLKISNNIIAAKSGQAAMSCAEFENSPKLKNNVVFTQGGSAYSGSCTDQDGINGNITTDPILNSTAFGYYGLRPGSPAIDAGNNTELLLPATDLSGSPRRIDATNQGVARVDIGAYEYDPAEPRAVVSGAPSGAVRETTASLTVGGTEIVSYHYALDGGPFTTADTPVSSPITLTGLASGNHAVAVIGKTSSREQLPSSATVAEWTIDAAPPVTAVSPASGVFTTPQVVTLTCSDGSGSGCAATYYCFGADCTPATPYTGPIAINSATGLRFYSQDAFGYREEVKTASFNFTGTISGIVTDSVTGSGIQGIYIAVYNAAAASSIGFTYTDNSGAYSLAGLASGSYKLRFTGTNYIEQWYSGKSDRAGAASVVLSAPGAITDINAVIVKGGSISGVVTAGDTGAGVGNVSVIAFNAVSEAIVGHGYTNDSGVYTISGLPAGDYKISFDCQASSGYLDQWYGNKADLASANIVAVTSAGTVPGINASLLKGGRISGTVTDSSGAVIPNAYVAVYDSVSGSWLTLALVDSSGVYNLIGLGSGRYKLNFSADGYITQWYSGKANWNSADPVAVTAPNATSGINMTLVKGGEITGTITDNATGSGLQNAYVYAVNATNGNWAGSVYTDSSGNYRISGLASGSYKLHFEASGYIPLWSGGKTDQGTAATIAVTVPNTTTGINMALVKGASISGVVVDGISGAAIQGVSVEAYNAATGSFTASTLTNDAGYYTVPGLAGGGYRLQFSAPTAEGYIVQWYSGKTAKSEATTVEVIPPGAVSGINVSMEKGAVITGIVTDRDTGMGIGSVSINAYDAITGFRIGYGTTGYSGAYSIAGLPSGTYKLQFSAGEFVAQWYGGKSDQITAASVNVVAPGTTTGIDVSLVRGGSISGTIADRLTGAGISEAYVYAIDRSSGNYAGGATTDANGSYRINNLANGSYKLRINAPYGSVYLDGKWYGDQDSYLCADTITVTAPAATTGIDALLDRGGSISGRVTDAATGEGIPNARSLLYRYSGLAKIGISGSVTTDSAGAYTIGGLQSGEYSLSFWAPDYIGTPSPIRVTVTAPAEVTNVDASLVRGGGISGRITDSITGEGVVDILVEAMDSVTHSMHGSDSTDYRGVYSLSGLPSGEYSIYYNGTYAGNGYSSGQSSNSATVTAPVITTGIDFAIVRLGSIAGRVTDSASNEPLANISVSAYDTLTGARAGSALTRYDGTYRISGLPTGSYRVQFSSGLIGTTVGGWPVDWAPSGTISAVAVQAPETTTGIDGQLVKGGSITGSVAVNSCPGPRGVEIMVYSATSGKLVSMMRLDTNNGEYFTISGLPAGSYKVAINPGETGFVRGWYPNSPDAAGAELITVTSGGITGGIDVTLVAGAGNGSISGNVTGDIASTAVILQLYDLDTGWIIANTTAAVDGSYQFTGLRDGNYKLSAMVGHLGTWYRVDGETGQASPIQINSGSAVTGIDLAVGNSPTAACGSADGATVTTAPTTGLCAAGVASIVSGSGPWTWSCSGTSSGVPASCAAILPQSGVLVPQPGKTEPGVSDALRMLRIAAGIITPTATDYTQGDVAPLDSNGRPKGNNVIDTYDVIGILRMAVGLL